MVSAQHHEPEDIHAVEEFVVLFFVVDIGFEFVKKKEKILHWDILGNEWTLPTIIENVFIYIRSFQQSRKRYFFIDHNFDKFFEKVDDLLFLWGVEGDISIDVVFWLCHLFEHSIQPFNILHNFAMIGGIFLGQNQAHNFLHFYKVFLDDGQL